MPPQCLPPKAIDTVPTARILPAGTCDTHMHVFGSQNTYPLSPLRNYTPHPVGWSRYREVMDVLGIARAVLVQPSVYGTDNRLLLETLASAPDELRGVVVVEPSIENDRIAALHSAGVRGIRINRRNPGGLTLQDMTSLAHRVASHGWHIQLQANLFQDPSLASLIERSPVPVVLDHMGFLSPDVAIDGAPFAGMLHMLERGNLWVKLSAPYHLSRQPRGDAPYSDLHRHIQKLISCRPDRLVWATDWPHTELYDHMPADTDPALLLTLDTASEDIRQQVFVDNPARLYGFE